ncbi:hypothetical protein L873DRAFT_897444 [Choiromyces venosus 120613-1]|uniref:Uncharacterized protein n=1 Tax=Choiromyces venosus 120613-1 TaxID=1336337 RepID=A0A3N4JTX9_9PEZI|nr:hypothetical protein L873DRAFT_897444 [Choiromyces venosus 120613-1]
MRTSRYPIVLGTLSTSPTLSGIGHSYCIKIAGSRFGCGIVLRCICRTNSISNLLPPDISYFRTMHFSHPRKFSRKKMQITNYRSTRR